MVIVDVDHPDIEKFVGWKMREEQKSGGACRWKQVVLEVPEEDNEGGKEEQSTDLKNERVKLAVVQALAKRVPDELHIPRACACKAGESGH